MALFFQSPPELGNQFASDMLLQSYLRRVVPDAMRREMVGDLLRLGDRVVTDIMHSGQDAESNPPQLVQYDPWGRRVDTVVGSRGWERLKDIAAEEGLVAIGYERTYGFYSRLYQFAKLYLFHPSSAVFTCPLAMTDGAARLIEVYGDSSLKKDVFPRLISRNPNVFWTSGQWMTERIGGSDVGETETVAKHEGDQYVLFGDKWFTSAVTSEMAMTLARIDDGKSPPGSRGVSLFYLETGQDGGRWNQIQINRLKDKLGTKALPTAELTLNGTPAKLIGERGKGVKTIATLFNITRIYNAICAVATMRRGIALANDYAKKRTAFGRLIQDHPLHRETLLDLEAEFSAAFLFTFYVAELLGKTECGAASESDQKLLRVLTPIVKLMTAKQGIAVSSEVLECVGGMGYIEDTGLPRLLRDAQVLSIWEGTTNVLSLDMLRAIQKEGAFEPLAVWCKESIDTIRGQSDSFDGVCGDLAGKINAVACFVEKISASGLSLDAQASCYSQLRRVAIDLGRVVSTILLIEHAIWAVSYENSEYYSLIAKRYAGRRGNFHIGVGCGR